jgi:glucose-6-phosphate 1-epimerase
MIEFSNELINITTQNSRFEVSTLGGQLVSWQVNGTDILFANTEYRINDGKTALRCGSPICFPFFGKGVLLSEDGSITEEILPQHGKSRTSVWKRIAKNKDSVTLETIQPYPGKETGEDLKIQITYSLSDTKSSSSISIDINIENIGDTDFLFQLALHSYWNCKNPSEFSAHGLGNEYLDNLKGLSKLFENDFNSTYPESMDRIYLNPSRTILISTPDYKLEISSEDFTNVVAWNPGIKHSLKDVKPNNPAFFCIENGVITPAPSIKKGDSLCFGLEYRATMKA